MTSTFSSTEVRFSRPDEFLRELAYSVDHDAVDYKIVRLAVVTEQGTQGDLIPGMKGFPDGDRPLHPDIKARWLQVGYTSRGQLVKLSAFLGLHRDGADLDDRWRTRNCETSDRELELVRTMTEGIEAHKGLEIRDGGLHGESPNWRAHEDIAAPQDVAQLCITCLEPIYHANGAFRHKATKRAEAYDEAPCPACKGSRAVPSRDYPGEYDRCRACETTPGVKLTLNHLADNEIEGRKV